MTTEAINVRGRPTVDIGQLVDEGAWNGSRKLVLVLAALAIVLDGLDNQVLGFAIPSMIAEWKVARSDFASALALGFVGMTIGTPVGGVLGDRSGRKITLIIAVVLFGLATAAIAAANGVFEVAIYRFLAGLGLGGALPAAMALIAEFTPKQNRSLSVLLGIVCIPIGGMIGGVIAAEILPTYGWRILFLVSGLAPMVVALILIAALPESPQHLLNSGANSEKIARSVRWLGASVTADSEFVDRREIGVARASLGALFTKEFVRSTLAMWVAFFFCLLPVYVLYAWTPTLLVGKGIDVKTASFGLALFNFGGVAGCLVAAWAIGWFGSRVGILTMAGGAVLGAVLLALLPLSPSNDVLIKVLLCVEGFFLLGAQGSLYALATYVYPTAIRSTGMGAAAGFGRAGAIVSAYVGSAALAVGSGAFFGVVVVCLAITFVAVAVVNIHADALRSTAIR
jgi:AAHS family 4-hydroxybenzoate transporter-like MFS transporter